jgi:DNA (cytosine-5)-methyltransferase 1
MILDLFAGPGGWSEGLRMLSPELHATELGMEWSPAATMTRLEAGHNTIRCDIAAHPTEPFVGEVTGLIASPPCQDFSLAGKRAGIEGDRGQLVHEVMRWTEALEPEWVICEQVPPVLEIWKAYATRMRLLGYSTWAGILNAANYGVPQTRKRALLIANRRRPALPPEPTHARNPEPSMFGDDLERWVSMADALGWGLPIRPYMTLTGSGLGGESAREYMRQQRRNGPWIEAVNTGRDWKPDGTREDAQTIPVSEPAPTLTGQAEAWQLRSGNGEFDRPAAPDGSHPLYNPETGEDYYQRFPMDGPACTITGSASGWYWERPATTLLGDDRVWPPGHKVNSDDIARLGEDEARERYGDRGGKDAIRLELSEALVLQSFPADYPVQGNKRESFLQVGNAVPPRLAAHVLAAVLGIDYRPETARMSDRAIA